MTKLVIKHLTKVRKQVNVLEDIHLELEDSTIYGLIGHNGAGKTTLFYSLLGLVDHSGALYLDEINMNEDKSKHYLKEIGVVVAFPEAYNQLTMRELFNDHLFYMGESLTTNIHALLESFGLTISLDTCLGDLSLGMKQKVNLALALSHNPKILLLDEPFNGLDREGINQLKSVLKELKEAGKMVIVSSHSFEVLENLIDTVIVIDHGKMMATNTMAEIYQDKSTNLESYYQNVTGGVSNGPSTSL